jgi:ADP-ribose pyrophosphatase
MEQKIKSKTVYKHKFLSVLEDDVKINNLETKRVVLKHPGGAACLATTASDEVILVKQFRYAINKYVIEVPAGKKDDDDKKTIETIKRELAEETNYSSNEVTYYKTIYPSVGYSSEKLDLYIAKNCFKLAEKVKQDEDESIEVLILKRNEVLKIYDEIIDPKTIILLNYYLKGECK